MVFFRFLTVPEWYFRVPGRLIWFLSTPGWFSWFFTVPDFFQGSRSVFMVLSSSEPGGAKWDVENTPKGNCLICIMAPLSYPLGLAGLGQLWSIIVMRKIMIMTVLSALIATTSGGRPVTRGPSVKLDFCHLFQQYVSLSSLSLVSPIMCPCHHCHLFHQ